MKNRKIEYNLQIFDKEIHVNNTKVYIKEFSDTPKVSALMVTKNRNVLAEIAIKSFINQTYINKELIIVDDSELDDLENFIKEINDSTISYYRLPSESLSLGELRNISVEKSSGEYVCQWDDDDLYHSERLEVQMSAILSLNIDGCYLDQLYSWWPLQEKISISCIRLWECTLLCRKSIMFKYPSIRKGEDSEMIGNISRNYRLGAIRGNLYIYGIHNNNTWDESHFDRQWIESIYKFENNLYDIVVRELSSIYKLDEYRKSIKKE